MDDVTKRARELVEAATAGSWHTGNQEVRASSAGGMAVAFCGESMTASGDGFHRIDVNQARANAAFIAASPDLVRGLLAENDRMRTVIYEAARALYDYDDGGLGAPDLNSMCANAYAILDAATPKAE